MDDIFERNSNNLNEIINSKPIKQLGIFFTVKKKKQTYENRN